MGTKRRSSVIGARESGSRFLVRPEPGQQSGGNHMAALKLVEFKADEETDEVGSDSPYFVFFIGKANTPETAQLVRIRQPHWDNEVDSGDLFKPNTNVAGGV